MTKPSGVERNISERELKRIKARDGGIEVAERVTDDTNVQLQPCGSD